MQRGLSWFRRLIFATLMGVALLAAGSSVAAPPAVTSEEEEPPAAEAPPAPREAPVVPGPRTKPARPAGTGGGDGAVKALAARVDKQAKELTQLKQENARLREQVKLLFSIVNKLAGLSQGK